MTTAKRFGCGLRVHRHSVMTAGGLVVVDCLAIGCATCAPSMTPAQRSISERGEEHELNLITILGVAITGDFPGYAATGVEEDSLIIILAVHLHSLFF